MRFILQNRARFELSLTQPSGDAIELLCVLGAERWAESCTEDARGQPGGSVPGQPRAPCKHPQQELVTPRSADPRVAEAR